MNAPLFGVKIDQIKLASSLNIPLLSKSLPSLSLRRPSSHLFHIDESFRAFAKAAFFCSRPSLFGQFGLASSVFVLAHSEVGRSGLRGLAGKVTRFPRRLYESIKWEVAARSPRLDFFSLSEPLKCERDTWAKKKWGPPERRRMSKKPRPSVFCRKGNNWFIMLPKNSSRISAAFLEKEGKKFCKQEEAVNLAAQHEKTCEKRKKRSTQFFVTPFFLTDTRKRKKSFAFFAFFSSGKHQSCCSP